MKSAKAFAVRKAHAPPSVLARIIARKRAEVAALKARPGMRALEAGLQPSTRSLRKNLARPGPRFIFEYKKASPASGRFQNAPGLAAAAKVYAPFADGVSVLTDRTFFKGSLGDLMAFCKRVTQPLLCKDFIIDERQVLLARRAGADAVLLMLSVLDDNTYSRLAALAGSLGMVVLSEVHSREEMMRAGALGANLIGINNRDLATFAVSLRVTEALAPLAPKGAVLVTESGIETRADVKRLDPLVDGFLVGTALMRAANIEYKARELVFGEVKICGLTKPEDARAAHDAGATYGGLIFVPGTPRALTPDKALAITRAAPLKWAGVFRGNAPERVAHLARRLKLSVVQLHGREDAAYRKALRALLSPSCEIWQAVAASSRAAGRIAPVPHADRVLLDTSCNGRFGGTGRSFDWRGLGKIPGKQKLGLAGGITPKNIPAAIATGIPLIDVGSGVEARPGVKSHKKITALFAAIRKADDRAPGTERM